jgi:hypothetical protein
MAAKFDKNNELVTVESYRNTNFLQVLGRDLAGSDYFSLLRVQLNTLPNGLPLPFFKSN